MNEAPKKFDLKIIKNEKKFDCSVEHGDNEFKVKINDTEFNVKDSIKLNEHIIRVQLNNSELVTMQLISKLANGEINLQYLGTKVSQINKLKCSIFYLMNIFLV